MKNPSTFRHSFELLNSALHWLAQPIRVKILASLLASGCAHSTLNDIELNTKELPVIFVEKEGPDPASPPENSLVSDLAKLELEEPPLDFKDWVVDRGKKVVKQASITSTTVGDQMIDLMTNGGAVITKMMPNGN